MTDDNPTENKDSTTIHLTVTYVDIGGHGYLLMPCKTCQNFPYVDSSPVRDSSIALLDSDALLDTDVENILEFEIGCRKCGVFFHQRFFYHEATARQVESIWLLAESWNTFNTHTLSI